MSNLAVEAKDWSWRHAGRRKPIIEHLDLSIADGERVLIVGASGAGKSTLVHGIAGLLGDGEDGDEQGVLEVGGVRARDARGAVGLVIQDPASQVLMEHLGDDVAFGCENLAVPRHEIWRRTYAALEQVGLALPVTTATHALSGGQQQRMALAGVLAMQPNVVALDEPTANLDPDGALQIRDAVAALPRTQTIIVVEHRLSLWLPVVDRMIVIGPTGVLADGKPAAVTASNAKVLADAGIWVPNLPIPDRSGTNVDDAAANILNVEHLSVGYGDSPVHSPITHAFAAGTCTAIIGKNGSGKSTFARTIAGLQRPLSGSVAVNPALAARRAKRLASGTTTDPNGWRSKDLPSRIGFVFQNPGHQFLAPSVEAELELARSFRAAKTSLATVPHPAAGSANANANATDNHDGDDLLEALGLVSLLKANPHTLSGGEQRRLSVATALAAAPPILILDEPTFGQDANTWRTLINEFARLRDAGHTLILVTHDLALIESMQPSILRLEHS